MAEAVGTHTATHSTMAIYIDVYPWNAREILDIYPFLGTVMIYGITLVVIY